MFLTISGAAICFSVSPLWPAWPPLLRFPFSRNDVVEGGLPNLSQDGGFERLLLFLFRRFSSSAIRVACGCKVFSSSAIFAKSILIICSCFFMSLFDHNRIIFRVFLHYFSMCHCGENPCRAQDGVGIYKWMKLPKITSHQKGEHLEPLKKPDYLPLRLKGAC